MTNIQYFLCYQDELASILRFGAEDLFKVNEAEGAEQLQKLRAEDIDSILERAEVVENRACEAGVAPELLNQFQVATFSTLEDDVAFWSKLIPESDRKRMEKQVRLLLCFSCFFILKYAGSYVASFN